ncbi:hypothetical protein ACFQX6_00550 [Streptosporangium lutulentum]
MRHDRRLEHLGRHDPHRHGPPAVRTADPVRRARRPLDGFTWRDGLVRLGHHTVDGSYAEVTVEAGGGQLHLVMAGGPTDALYVRAKGTAGVLVVLDGWRGTDVAADGGLVRVGGELWRVDGSVPAEGLVLEFADEVDLYVAPEGVPGGAHDVAAVLDRRRAEAERTAPRSSGWLGDAAAAATRAVTWNTIYAPDLGRVLTPTSRDFVSAQRRVSTAAGRCTRGTRSSPGWSPAPSTATTPAGSSARSCPSPTRRA